MKDKVWERVRVSVKDCPRITKSFLREERMSLTESMYKQEYEIEFIEQEGEVISMEYIDKSLVGDFELFPGEELLK